MSVENNINVLRAEIKKALIVIEKLESFLLDFYNKRSDQLNQREAAMVVTQGISNYYTCIETVFVRISKFFENSLDTKQWHRSLLDKMTLEIDDIRPRIISDDVYRGLLELLKFRHFSRYYFELDYDWDKLNFLLKKFNDIRIPIKNELTIFEQFLFQLESNQNSR